MQDRSNPIANALELLQFCAKSSICTCIIYTFIPDTHLLSILWGVLMIDTFAETRVIVRDFSSLVAPEVVVMTSCGAPNNEKLASTQLSNFIICFQYTYQVLSRFYIVHVLEMQG